MNGSYPWPTVQNVPTVASEGRAPPPRQIARRRGESDRDYQTRVPSFVDLRLNGARAHAPGNAQPPPPSRAPPPPPRGAARNALNVQRAPPPPPQQQPSDRLVAFRQAFDAYAVRQAQFRQARQQIIASIPGMPGGGSVTVTRTEHRTVSGGIPANPILPNPGARGAPAVARAGQHQDESLWLRRQREEQTRRQMDAQRRRSRSPRRTRWETEGDYQRRLQNRGLIPTPGVKASPWRR